MNKSTFKPSASGNQMSFSNPIHFKNIQNYNPTYATQLQEQFYKITQFCQESSYNPQNKKNGSNESELLEKKDLIEENVRKTLKNLKKNY